MPSRDLQLGPLPESPTSFAVGNGHRHDIEKRLDALPAILAVRDGRFLRWLCKVEEYCTCPT